VKAAGLVKAKVAGSLAAATTAATVLITAPLASTPNLVVVPPSMCPTSTLSGGSYFGMAVEGSGVIRSWGAGADELGNGSQTSSLTPVTVSVLTTAVSVAAGTADTLALQSDGSVWGWGANAAGELGINTTTPQPSPVRIAGLPSDTIAVSMGNSHALALTASGAVWGWGSNASGQLGTSVGSGSLVPVPLPGLGSGIVAVAAGSDYSLALQSNGTVLAWGNNRFGTLGNGTTTNSPVPAPIQGLPGAVAISAGTFFALALTANGEVWAWGDGGHGELGNGAFASSLLPVKVLAPTGTIAISAGGAHVLALRSDHTVWAWGANDKGQLGSGGTTDLDVPTQVVDLATDVVGIAAGGDFSLAVHLDGTVSAWGGNAFGQLGLGNTTNALTPQTNPNLAGIAAPILSCGSGGGGGGGSSLPRLQVTLNPVHTTLTWSAALVNYTPNPFTVSATISNIGTGATEGLQATLLVPTGLSLEPSQIAFHSLNDLSPGASETTTWLVRAAFQQVDTTLSYSVTAAARNAVPATAVGTVFVPKVPRRIVYVHGLAESFTDVQNFVATPGNFSQPPFSGPFVKRLADLYGADNVQVFGYYQDLGYRQPTGVCTIPNERYPDTATGSLYVDPNSVNNSICDGVGALAYSATKLDDELAGYPGPTTLIANSVGASVVRGWLALVKADRPSSTALASVDSVIFIEGSQQGVYIAAAGQVLANTPPQLGLQAFVQQMTNTYFGFTDLSRPGFKDIQPSSNWYLSVNPKGVPSQLHYYNFFNDLGVRPIAVMLWGRVPLPPFTVGDGVILPGDPNPLATPPGGGEEFLPGGVATQDRYEWELSDRVYDFLLQDPTTPTVLDQIIADPTNHAQLMLTIGIPQSDNQLKIDSCIRGHGQETVFQKITEILAEPAHGCNP
jgi:alpha-tubulin suppressor-like RCC1 family protein